MTAEGPPPRPPEGGEVGTELHPPFPGWRFSIVGGAADRTFIEAIARDEGRYEPELLALLGRLLGPASVSVDAGANLGIVSLVMSRLSPGGRVHAFEPAPETVAQLRANLEANGATNVEIVAAALWDEPGRLRFSFEAGFAAGSHVVGAGDLDEGGVGAGGIGAGGIGAGGIGGSDVGAGDVGGVGAGDVGMEDSGHGLEVEVVRLDDWAEAIGLERLDLVKVDVEGAELRALAGASRVLARFRPALLVELNPVALLRFESRSWRELAEALEDAGYHLGVPGAGGRPVRLLGRRHLARHLARSGVVNVLAVAGWRRLGRFRPTVAGIVDAVRLWSGDNCLRVPFQSIVSDPDVDLAVASAAIDARPGELLSVPVTVTNRTGSWLSSTFTWHPVSVSYRICAGDGETVVAEGHRSPLPAPLLSGRTAEVDATVVAPSEPGAYRLGVTLVQEQIAWFDELCPGTVAWCDLTVSA